MKKRFILLIDFSRLSGNLIRYASEWAQQINAELLLVHKITVLAPALADDKSRQQIAQYNYLEALEKMNALAKEIIPQNVLVSYSISENNLEITLLQLLGESFENLVFVGLKGTGFLKKIFLGSVALQVIENLKGITVAMPKEISTFSHIRIFVGVTENYPLNIIELKKFLNFIDKEKTSIIFFHLSKPHEKITGMETQLENLVQFFSSKFNASFRIYEGNDPFLDIKRVINNKYDEMLIVQKGSRLLTDQLFRKFLVNDLVYEGQTPLIILP